MRNFSPEEAVKIANSVQSVCCKEFHTGSCVMFTLSYFGAAFLQSLKFYIPLQFLPLLMRMKQLKKEKLLSGALRAALRSTLMLSGMVGLAKCAACTWLGLFHKCIRGTSILFVASIVVIATLIESQAKVSEMSLYVLPRFLDAFWNFLQRRGIVAPFVGGKVLMFSLATSLLTYCYENEVRSKQPENLRGYYKTLMHYLLGSN